MVDQDSARKMALYRVMNLCLVLTVAYSLLCLAIFLRVKGAVCSTTSPGIDFALGFVRQFCLEGLNEPPLTLAVCPNNRRRRTPLLLDLSPEAKAPDNLALSGHATTRLGLRCRSSMVDVPVDDTSMLQSARRPESSCVLE
jgi:hypothetical protein